MEFVKIYRTRVPNAAISLANTIPTGSVFAKLQSQQAKDVFSRLLKHERLNFWDFGVRASPHISIGDSVRIICQGTCYSCHVIDKLDDPSGEVGDLFGWARMYQAPYSHIFALNVLSTRPLAAAEINAIVGGSTRIIDTFYRADAPIRVQRHEALVEGNIVELTLTRYERDPALRRACLEHFGANCQVCGFDFGTVYGEIGHGFIHVHHLVPLAQVCEAHMVDPIRDLVPVCPNCHAMLHIPQGEPLSIDALKAIIRQRAV